MSDVVIRAENLGKKYRIEHQRERQRYVSLRDVVTHKFLSPWRRLRQKRTGTEPSTSNHQSHEDFWALKDVSFEVKQGEVLGIIGHNGAGKSTLLKIFSRITEPTKGRVKIRGRVSSLLEVGTGFHPELTGRENIYLNGAVLGMSHSEVKRKFDEIVSFAEVEKFIDTPVKRFSSGMYMRLAFAVAVHLEPEVLIVDEVLAVGDAEFQKKCFQKMQEIGRSDRTILLVSHNLSAIRTICRRALILDQGQLVELGPVEEVTDKYLAKISEPQFEQHLVETETFVIDYVLITSDTGPVIKTFDAVKIKVRVTTKADVIEPDIYIGLQTMDAYLLSAVVLRDFCTVSSAPSGHSIELTFSINSLSLLPGSYQIKLHLVDVVGYKFEVAPVTFPFEVVESAVYGGRKLDRWFGHIGLNAEATAQVLPPG